MLDTCEFCPCVLIFPLSLTWFLPRSFTPSCPATSFYAKLCLISRHGTESLYIAEIQQFLRAVTGAAEVLRLALYELFPARYGLPGMRATEYIMTGTLEGTQAVDI